MCWDVAGRIIEANDAFLALVGYNREGLFHRKLNWIELTPPEYHAADVRAVETLRRTGSCAPYEKEFLRSDGRRIPILVGASFLDASRQHGVAFLLDLTEHHRADAERQARQVAEAANRAKSEFLANMSHDLRTPLNGILGYAQLLRRDPSLTESHHSAIEVIQQSGEQLLTLINDLLDLAKIEAGRLELRPVEFSLPNFLGGLMDVVTVSARQKGLQFMADFQPGLPARVRADDQCLRRILLNLLSNAVKFTDRGGVTLRVRFLPSARLRFEVIDTGIGIRADHLERIFEPFEQVGEASRCAGGTGLGLTISRELVQRMGGELRANSYLGHGSTFWFELQIPVLQETEVNEPVLPIPATYGPSPELREQGAASEDLVAPPESELESLYVLAQQGCMRDIAQHAERIALMSASYDAFARELLRLARDYQSQAILTLIERYRQSTDSQAVRVP
jgi:PAS domain S-box-containing protein